MFIAVRFDGYLRAGDVRFADLNGDNVIGAGAGTVDDPGDKQIIGNTTPRYSYSFRLDASWNGFDVSAFFQGLVKETGTHLIVPPHREQIHSGDHILSLLPHL